tara:strand:+ start:5636 stop:6358 length:723 start_codon:yes stop_codon:yes gene_type:complete
MGAAVALGAASLAMGVAGSISSASAGAANAKAQHAQAEINRKWQEFDKQMELTRQRGAMGIAEYDRLFANNLIEKESLQQMVLGKEAAKRQQDYMFTQASRAHRTMREKQRMSSGSRGMARGGTADALARQTDSDFNSDMVRMRNNNAAQMSMFTNQRNSSLRQRNMRPVNQPPTYVPSTPIPAPNNAQYTGQIMGAVAQGLGGMAGAVSGMGSSPAPTAGQPGSPLMGPVPQGGGHATA